MSGTRCTVLFLSLKLDVSPWNLMEHFLGETLFSGKISMGQPYTMCRHFFPLCLNRWNLQTECLIQRHKPSKQFSVFGVSFHRRCVTLRVWAFGVCLTTILLPDHYYCLSWGGCWVVQGSGAQGRVMTEGKITGGGALARNMSCIVPSSLHVL